MIRVDPAVLIAFFFLVVLSVVCLVWLVSWIGRRRKGEDGQEAARIRRCPYCGHAFTEYVAREVAVCPLCKSFLEGNQHA